MSQAPNPHQSTTTAPRLAWLLSRASLTLSQKPLGHSLSPSLGSLPSQHQPLYPQSAYQVSAPCSSHHSGVGGWAGLLCPHFSISHSSVNQGSFHMGSADCFTKWPYRLFRLISVFFCVPVTTHLFLGQHQGRELEAINLSSCQFLKSLSHSCHEGSGA